MNTAESFRLDGKVAIVTGASKGIGLAIAQALASQGARVVLSSRKQDSVDTAAAELNAQGFEATGIAAHMGDMEQVAQLAEATVKRYGGIDILVNNAAINPVFGPIAETDLKAFDKIMEVNVKGPMELSKRAFPIMASRGGGSIVNISSIEGIRPGLGLGLYSISKSALIALTKVMAREWGAQRVRVNAICPGLVKTKFSEALTSNEKIMNIVMKQQALPQVAEPADIAGLALFLSAPASAFCTGGIYMADGGYTI